MNRTFYLLPLACLLGFAVGYWGPRADMRAMKELTAKEKKSVVEKRRGGFDTFAQLAKIPETASRPRHGQKPRKAAKRSAIAVTNAPKEAAAAPASEEVAANKDENPRQEWRRMSPEDLRARIAEAQDLWAVRVDVARAQWKAKLGIAGDAEKAFDDALQEMNENLYMSVANLAERLAGEEKMTPELGLRLVGDTTTIMAEAYDKIGASVAPEMRGEVSNIKMTDFIDPAVAEPLIDVQDKLQDFQPRPRGRDAGQ